MHTHTPTVRARYTEQLQAAHTISGHGTHDPHYKQATRAALQASAAAAARQDLFQDLFLGPQGQVGLQ